MNAVNITRTKEPGRRQTLKLSRKDDYGNPTRPVQLHPQLPSRHPSPPKNESKQVNRSSGQPQGAGYRKAKSAEPIAAVRPPPRPPAGSGLQYSFTLQSWKCSDWSVSWISVSRFPACCCCAADDAEATEETAVRPSSTFLMLNFLMVFGGGAPPASPPPRCHRRPPRRAACPAGGRRAPAGVGGAGAAHEQGRRAFRRGAALLVRGEGGEASVRQRRGAPHRGPRGGRLEPSKHEPVSPPTPPVPDAPPAAAPRPARRGARLSPGPAGPAPAAPPAAGDVRAASPLHGASASPLAARLTS